MKNLLAAVLGFLMLLGSLTACETFGVENEEENSRLSSESKHATEDAPSDRAPTEAEQTEEKPSALPSTDTQACEKASTETEPSDTGEGVLPLPEFPSDDSELEMMYRCAHGLEDDTLFEEYVKNINGKIPLPALFSVDHISLGMTSRQVLKMIPAYCLMYEISRYRVYKEWGAGQPFVGMFFIDCDRRGVVLEFDLDERVEKITVYDELVKEMPLASEIDAIPEGATVYEVIEVLGFPRLNDGHDGYWYCFTDNEYRFGFVDYYDNNLRLYSSELDRLTEDLLVFVDRAPSWYYEDSSEALETDTEKSPEDSKRNPFEEIPTLEQITMGEERESELTCLEEVTYAPPRS